jgi:S1/P1 Nuclease
MVRKATASLALLVGLFVTPAVAYGPRGHSMVGAIADQRLAGKPVATKIGDLLDGLTLAEAALLPDSIKAWDRKDPDDPDTFHLPEHPAIEAQLKAFVRANPHTNQAEGTLPPSHHWFHYTDIPVTGNSKYADGKRGRSPFDVVQMIPFCINVIQGNVPEANDRKITKPLAVILLAHYLGDLHQPLHVGSQYFDDQGQPVNPDSAGAGAGDNGGNNLTLILNRPNDHGHATTHAILHSYWDGATVTTAMGLVSLEIRTQRKGAGGQINDTDIARRLAAVEPKLWKAPADLPVDKWSVLWADEIMPLAREAHNRLTFQQIKIDSVHKTAKGMAVENGMPTRTESYADWSGKVVRDRLHTAGWRLAELLEQIVE